MKKIEFDAYRHSKTIVSVLGILGNILVILSILRQKINLQNNYYFLVLHLAICDLLALIIYFYNAIEADWLGAPLSDHTTKIHCHVYVIEHVFQFSGVGVMLIISVLCYRATVHPLKPAISRRKLKGVCGLAYLVGLIAAYGTRWPLCLIKSNVVYQARRKLYFSFSTFFGCVVPTIFMAVVYYKVVRALIKQNKYMKRVCSNAMRRRTPDTSFNILRHIRNRRTFLVCLSTVLCYGIAHIPMSVLFISAIARDYHHLPMKYGWVWYLSYVLKIAGSHSVNPLIYGILDKKLLSFCKCCCKKKQKTK